MNCTICNKHNDDDAAFCVNCGEPLEGEQARTLPSRRRSFRYVFVLIIAFLSLLGLGYYKFFLPRGVVAVVNGDVITRSELDSAVTHRMKEQSIQKRVSAVGGNGKERERLRYAVLSEMIRQRILLQEASKAGVQVTEADVDAALERMRLSAGMSRGSFNRSVSARHGGVRMFREAVKRDMLINKLISENVVKGIADPHRAQEAARNWFRDVTSRAAVRIALSEQWSGADCGCCSGDASLQDRTLSSDREHRCGGSSERPLTAEEKQRAAQAGRDYWRQRFGNEPVIARVIDLGCHVQIDIEKDGKAVKSLRYQDGMITEL